MHRLKKILLLCTATIAVQAHAQYGYWQQRAEYKMNIDFDATQHQYKGKQTLTYYNNSPDTLRRLFYHLYFNAFQPGSSMDVRSRTISDPDKRVGERISKLKPNEIGYQKILSLKMNGEALSYEVQGTILEVQLKKPIAPKTKVVLEMDFESQVPVQIRRSGRNSQDGVDYSMTQWYPKLCEYDHEGWHADPYIGREFYGVWGDFDVTISMDKAFLIGATGVLQNPQEIGKGYEDKSKPLKQPSGNKLNWHFKATNVHDFAWAADKDYQHDMLQVPDGPLVHFIYQNDNSAENWKKIQPVMVKFFQLTNLKFGKYPYPAFSFIQGGDGGMEYPMMTLVTSRGSLNGLISVCVHEALHNWYYGVLGTNESKYPWMDEGFTTFAQDVIMNEILSLGQDNPHAGSYADYIDLIKSGEKEPLTTHADFYHKNGTYGTSAYSSGAVFLYQLSYIIGRESFNAGMLRYFNEWKFRHPAPNDFIRVMEKQSGLELDWYLEQFIGSMNEIDYSIKTYTSQGNSTTLYLQRIGQFPMPLDIYVEYTDGSAEIHYIPLDLLRGNKQEKTGSLKTISHTDWPWVYPEYSFTLQRPVAEIKQIIIDPTERLCDIDYGNNAWPPAGTIILQDK